jgi:hypothetical protein
MNRANRKTKLSRYEVTLRREIEYITILRVHARNADEAEQIATNIADNDPASWREDRVLGQNAKAKVIRG